MVSISRDEAAYLRANGRGHDIHMSSCQKKSKGKRYYASESLKTMDMIEKYRKSKIVETHVGR